MDADEIAAAEELILKRWNGYGDQVPPPGSPRERWDVALDALKLCRLTGRLYSEIALFLHHELSAQRIESVRRPGLSAARTKPRDLDDPDLRANACSAVLYWRAAKAGIVADRSIVQTIGKALGYADVGKGSTWRKIFRNWRQELGTLPETDPSGKSARLCELMLSTAAQRKKAPK